MLVNELLTEILCFVNRDDICRYTCCSRRTREAMERLGFRPGQYRKAVSCHDLDSYRRHFLMHYTDNRHGLVSLLPLPFERMRKTECKMLIQALRLGQESDAAEWVSRRYATRVPHRRVHWYRRTLWDFWLYSVTMMAVRRPNVKHTGRVEIQLDALPLLCRDGSPLPYMTIMLTRFFLRSLDVDLVRLDALKIRGDLRARDQYFPWTVRDHVDMLHKLLGDMSWEDQGLTMQTQTCFRSSTIAVGTMLGGLFRGKLAAFELVSYAFDDGILSSDCMLLASFLGYRLGGLRRVHLSDVVFTSGQDMTSLMEILVEVPTLKSLSLHNVFSYTPTPRDILDVIGHGSCCLSRLVVNRVSRRLDVNVFRVHPTLRTLVMKNMYLCLSSMVPLSVQLRTSLPSLTRLDLSDNALAHSSIPSIVSALRSPCCHIKRLNLSGNHLSTANVSHLCTCLDRLDQLEINDNFLGERGATLLLQNPGNLTLLSMDLNSIHMTMERLRELLRSLRDKQSPLREVRMRHNYLGPGTIEPHEFNMRVLW